MEWFNKFDWEMILIVSLGTTVLVELINRITPEKVTSKIILPLVALAVTLLRIPLEAHSFNDWRSVIFNVLVTASLAVLIYEYGGKKVLEWVFETVFARYFPKKKNDGTEEN